MNTKDRVQLFLWVHPETRDLLKAFQEKTYLPHWRLIEMATDLLAKELKIEVKK